MSINQKHSNRGHTIFFHHFLTHYFLFIIVVKGYFHCLYNCIEHLLGNLEVKHFVIPAADEAETFWTSKFGFSKITTQQVIFFFFFFFKINPFTELTSIVISLISD